MPVTGAPLDSSTMEPVDASTIDAVADCVLSADRTPTMYSHDAQKPMDVLAMLTEARSKAANDDQM